MCHTWTRIFCGSDYISKIARAEPDGSAILGPGGAIVEARCQSVSTVEKHDGRFSSAVPDFDFRGSLVGAVAQQSAPHAHVEDTIAGRQKLLPHMLPLR